MDSPQLVMVRRDLDGLPPLFEVPGYRLRKATLDDCAGLAWVLSAAFEEEWTAQRAHAEFFDNPYVLTTFVATDGASIVATASAAHDATNRPAMGTLHWVAANPVHQGRRLGECVSLAVLHEFRARGLASANLTTDDPRIAAIRTYLRLGFEPEHTHPSHTERWMRVFEQIP